MQDQSHLILSGEVKKWPGVAVAVQEGQVSLQPMSAKTL